MSPLPTAGTEHTATCMKIYDIVRSTGIPNYLGARIPLPHALNVPVWRQYLANFTQDRLLCDFLDFGWPANYTAAAIPTSASTNHGSALAFPQHVSSYLETELEHGALLGPFDTPPFAPWFQVNALMSRPKKSTDNARRIIMDLSWPPNLSVNDGIPRDTYCGTPYKLRLPTVDDAVELILKHGPGCVLFSIDLSRAYRQLRTDPLDWPLLGLHWGDHTFLDIAIPFGLPWGAMACTRMSNGIQFIMHEEGYDVLPYIDDFLGVAPSLEAAQAAFTRLRTLLAELGVTEACAKAISPTLCLPWIGVEFDTQAMEIRMPQEKIDDTLDLLNEWRHRTKATLPQLRKLLGKLFHIGQTCKPARLFVSRMLETLRAAPRVGTIGLSDSFQRDITWFLSFLPMYNGLHLLQPSPPTFTVEVDSCLTGCGGFCDGYFYHTQFPPFITQQDLAIHQLEMLNIVIAVKLWHENWPHARVRVLCDNASAVAVLNSGRGRDPFLLRCAREIWLLSALHDFQVEAIHTPGTQLTIADSLSRYHTHSDFHTSVAALEAQGLQPIEVDSRLFHLTANI